MPAEELGQILQFCQPGTVIDPNVAREGTVGACKIYEFVTESGQNMGTVVEETVDLGNGTLATIKNFCTVAAGSGLATLSGIAAMPVTLTTATSVIAGLLGITTGVALYNSFPDFFNMVSDAIFGDAVDGLPVIFFDHNGNIRVAENTVNAVKDIAVEQKVYQPDPEVDTSKYSQVSNWYARSFINTLEEFTLADVPSISDTLSFWDNYQIAFADFCDSSNPNYKGAFFASANKRWMEYFGNDTVSAKENRQKLLTFLNKYWSSNKFLMLEYSNAAGFSIQLVSFSFFNKLKKNMLDYGIIYSGSSWYIVPLKSSNYTFVTGRYNDSKMFPGQRSLMEFTGTVAANAIQPNGYTVPEDTNNNIYFHNQPAVNIYSQTSGAEIAPFHEDDVPVIFDLFGYYRTRTPRGNNEMIILGDTPGTYKTIDNYDLDFMDPSGYFYVHHMLPNIIPGPVCDAAESPKRDSALGIPRFMKEREHYNWVYPDTVIPQEGVPVTETYPNLDVITDPGIGNLIAVTPPDLMPNPSQEAAQTSDPDANPGGYADFITENISDVNPTPEPSPDPAPDPAPSPEPAPDPGPSPQPSGDDPVNPNVNPQPDPTPVIDPTLQSIDSSRLFTVYWLSANELDQLGAYLWSTNFITAVEKIWQDPMQAIISLKKVYAQPLSVSRQNIILGFLDSGVSARVVSSQFVTKSYGTISVKEIMHNATDYSPYSQAMIYLPFIGIEQIDIDDIMGGDLTVRYTFDLYTGICIAELFVLRDDLTPQKMLYTFTGNVAQDVPLTSASFQGFFSTLMSIASTPLLVGSGGGILAASHLAHSMNHELVHISHSGNLSANAGIMGNRYPQLILTNRNRYDAAAYNTIYGYPANKTVYLGNCSGYTKVKAIQLQTFATQDEKNEIERLLKEGVIF